MPETQYQIYDAEQKRRYYSQMPNLIDDLGLSIFAYRLYGRLKRVTGDSGNCYQGITKLSKDCRMSRSSVIKARKELEERGLIIVTTKENYKNGEHEVFNITITDIWDKNIEVYDRQREEKKLNGFYTNGQPAKFDENTSPNMDWFQFKFEPVPVQKCTATSSDMHLKNIEYKRKRKEKEAPKNGAGAIPEPEPEPQSTPEKKTDTGNEKPGKKEPKVQPALEGDPLAFLPATVRQLGVSFLEEAGASYTPIKVDYGLWRKTLNEWAARRFSPELVKLAVREMRRLKLTIGGPQSITKVANSLKGNMAKEDLRIWKSGDPR